MVDQVEIHRKVLSGRFENRMDAAMRLFSDFADLPDKTQAWEDLHRLTGDKNSDVRWSAAKTLHYTFQHVPDKVWHGKT